jgi:hypothetical protein
VLLQVSTDYVTLQNFTPQMDWSPSTTSKVDAKMMDLESIWHATTFLQWDKGTCYIFQTKPSWHFTQWDPGG